jgi:hypothetical protein
VNGVKSTVHNSQRLNIGVVGSRRRNSEKDKQIVWDAITKLIDEIYKSRGGPQKTLIQLVSGGCRVWDYEAKKYKGCGADYFAEEYAKEYGFSIMIHYPRYHTRDYGKVPLAEATRINYERNDFIARDSDFIIAAVAPDRKGGTEDALKRFYEYQRCNEDDWKINLV